MWRRMQASVYPSAKAILKQPARPSDQTFSSPGLDPPVGKVEFGVWEFKFGAGMLRFNRLKYFAHARPI